MERTGEDICLTEIFASKSIYFNGWSTNPPTFSSALTHEQGWGLQKSSIRDGTEWMLNWIGTPGQQFSAAEGRACQAVRQAGKRPKEGDEKKDMAYDGRIWICMRLCWCGSGGVRQHWKVTDGRTNERQNRPDGWARVHPFQIFLASLRVYQISRSSLFGKSIFRGDREKTQKDIIICRWRHTYLSSCPTNSQQYY